MKFFLFFISLLNLPLFSQMIISLNEIQEYKINSDKVLYEITAKKKNVKPDIYKDFKIYNKENIISSSNYYLDGELTCENLQIKFKKAYFLEGNFIMIDLKGNFKETFFNAKKAVYSEEKLSLKNVFINLEDRNYRKIQYVLNLK